MSHYTADIHWTRGDAPFADNRYSRLHRWNFDGGVEVPASSSPHVVPLPMSELAAVDPKEAFVASLASCHMLFFLSFAAKAGFVVDDYRDHAVGELGKDAGGKQAMVRVTMHPAVQYVGERRPSLDEAAALHHQTHENCFIANSVKTEVLCEPVTSPV